MTADRSWPLTGRDEELRAVRAALRRDGGLVLAGAAGVGKTRLAREALATARGSVAWVTATASARGIPLGAFAPLLGAEADGTAPTLHRAAERLSGCPLLVVDDAHLLDDASAALLHQLVLARAVTVVVTLCSGQPAPDAVRALWKDEFLPRLEVRPLSEQQTQALVGSVLGGHVDAGTRSRMWALTRGNALFLRQLVDGERAGRRLRPVREVWRWDDGPTAAPGLIEIVDTRIGTVTDAQRRALEILALGEPLDVDMLERLVDPVAVDGVESRGLVAVETSVLGVEARLAHPLYGEVLRGRIPPRRARRLRGELARALAAAWSRGPDGTLRRAVLELDSDLPPDPALFTRAAEQAVTLLDLPLAERLGRAALAAGAGFGTGLTLAYVLSGQGRSAEAGPVLDAVTPRDDGQRAQLAGLRAATTFFASCRPAAAREQLETALGELDAGAGAELRAVRATFDAHQGRLSDAIATGRAVLADPGSTDGARTWAGFALGHALGRAGRTTEAVAATGRLRRGGGGPVIDAQLDHADVTTLTLAGDLAAAAARVERHPGRGATGPTASLMAGHVAVARGHLPDAVHGLFEARAGVVGRDPGPTALHAALLLPQVLGMLGDGPGAREAQAAAEAGGHPGITVTVPDLLLGRAWTAAAEGVTSEAARHAREAARVAAAGGQHAVEVLALHTAVCFGDGTVADRLSALAATVEGPRAPLAAAHAHALARRDVDALDRASRGWEELGAAVLAADAAAQAAACADGPQRAVSAARARRLAADAGGASTPALRALPTVEPLTAREREVVALAAGGRTNHEIAARLVVSVRTVEGHLYRSFAKLGVTERSALAEVL